MALSTAATNDGRGQRATAMPDESPFWVRVLGPSLCSAQQDDSTTADAYNGNRMAEFAEKKAELLAMERSLAEQAQSFAAREKALTEALAEKDDALAAKDSALAAKDQEIRRLTGRA